AEDGIRDRNVTGVQTCALPILNNIDERARKILGFDKEEELEYDEVVDRYLLTLANYVINLDDEIFFTPGIFHNLNYSLYHLTGRSEERRVGKVCRCRMVWVHYR